MGLQGPCPARQPLLSFKDWNPSSHAPPERLCKGGKHAGDQCEAWPLTEPWETGPPPSPRTFHSDTERPCDLLSCWPIGPSLLPHTLAVSGIPGQLPIHSAGPRGLSLQLFPGQELRGRRVSLAAGSGLHLPGHRPFPPPADGHSHKQEKIKHGTQTRHPLTVPAATLHPPSDPSSADSPVCVCLP